MIATSMLVSVFGCTRACSSTSSAGFWTWLDSAALAADYVASIADHYQDEVDGPGIIEDVRRAVQKVIDEEGALTAAGDTAAFVCR